MILERAGEEHLCPGCEEDGCFDRTAKRLQNGHLTSQVFIQEAGRTLGAGQHAAALDRLEGIYADLEGISSGYLDWRTHPDDWASPEVRRQIQVDFEKMRTLHEQAAAQFQALEESGSL